MSRVAMCLGWSSYDFIAYTSVLSISLNQLRAYGIAFQYSCPSIRESEREVEPEKHRKRQPEVEFKKKRNDRYLIIIF
jgi:hypothetical protein